MEKQLAVGMPLLCAFLAFFGLTSALLRTAGTIGLAPNLVDWFGLGLVLSSLAVAVVGIQPGWLLLPRRLRTWNVGPRLRKLGMLALAILLASELVVLGIHQPTMYREPPDPDWPLVWFRIGVAILALLAVSYFWPGRWACWAGWARWRFGAMLLAFGFLGGWMIMAETEPPFIDVWYLQQDACAELAAGRNPYSAEYVNIYGDTRFIAPEILHNGRVQSFPYPPVSLLLAFPGYLLGDVRWSLLLAMMASGALMVATGRRLGLPAGHPVELIVLALLCLPTPGLGADGLGMLEMAWTEPFVLVGILVSIWALASGRQSAAVAGLAIALGAKQYVFLCLPAWWAARRLPGRYLLAALAGAALLTLPFFIWDPRGLWNGLVRFHLYSPFRDDSLSLLAAIKLETGHQLPSALGFLAAFAVGAVAARPQSASLARILLASAAIFLAFFAFNKAAHLNYYWLALALLTAAVVVATAESAKAQTEADQAGHPGMQWTNAPGDSALSRAKDV